MEAKSRFNVILSNEAQEFLDGLPSKVREKIVSNFRAFWDKGDKVNTLVIATHGFIKKTQKTPSKEITKAEEIRKDYFNSKR